MSGKSLRSKHWFARFDGEKEFLRRKCEELARCLDVTAMLAVYHEGNTRKDENPHVHFVIELNAEPQKQTFAVRLKKLFDLPQSFRDYSLGPWDGRPVEGASSYLFHEETLKENILVNKGWSESQIDLAIANDKKIKEVVAINKERASNKLVDKALARFKGKRLVTKHEVLVFMLMECKQGRNYLPKEFLLRHYLDEVMFGLTPEDEVDDYASNLLRKWEPRI